MREVELPQGTIDVHESGPVDAPPVVLVHGFAADHRLWDPVAGRLATDHRVIAPDLPLGAHRRAMRPDADLRPWGQARLVADLLAALDLRDVVLVGNDTGGAVCQMVAARHPERLGGLVLTNCDAFEVFPPLAFSWFRVVPRIPGATWALAQSLRVEALHRLPVAYGDLSASPLPPGLTADWVRPIREDAAVRRDARKLLLGVHPRETQAAARELARFDKPALLVWGTADRHFRPALADRLAAVLPDAEVRRVEGAKTYVMRNDPEAVAGHVRRFVAERVRRGDAVRAG